MTSRSSLTSSANQAKNIKGYQADLDASFGIVRALEVAIYRMQERIVALDTQLEQARTERDAAMQGQVGLVKDQEAEIKRLQAELSRVQEAYAETDDLLEEFEKGRDDYRDAYHATLSKLENVRRALA